MKKRLMGLISLLAAACFLMTACATPAKDNTSGGGNAAPAATDGESKEGKTQKSGSELFIGMAFQEMNNEYFVVMKEALEEACQMIGAKCIYTDAAHDVSKQISDVEDMVEQGINILLLNPADTAGIEPAVKYAHDKGVVVVCVDAQANGPVDSFVGSKNYDAGYMAGKEMIKDLGGKGNVAILDGIPVTPILDRVAGFTDAVKEAPEIKIVDTQNGKQERDIALTVVENMLQSNANLDAIFSVNDTGTMGALAAVQGAGSDVLLYSVDGSPEAIKAISSGTNFKATSAQYPRDQVRIGLGMALAKYWGATVVPTEVPIDVTLINKSNAEGFAW